MKKVRLVVAMVAACAAGSVFAQQGLYVGGSLGQSMTSFDSEFSSGGTSSSQEKTKTAYKGFVGYSINQYLAVEGGYANFGKPKAKVSGTGWSGENSQEESAWFGAAKGTLPINEQLNLFAKLGVTYNKVTGKWNATGESSSASKSRAEMLYGVGAEYNLTKQVGIRLEYEDFGKFGDQFTNTGGGTGRTKTSMWSLGAAYKF